MFPPTPRAAILGHALAGAMIVPCLLPAGIAAAPAVHRAPHIIYQSPRPDARLVSPRNNIILRVDEAVDPGSLDPSSLAVIGARSGRHAGSLMLSDDGRTLVFQPDAPFAPGEHVSVRFDGRVRARTGSALPARSFGFTVTTSDPAAHADLALENLMRDLAPPPVTATEAGMDPIASAATACDTFPTGYPSVVVTRSDPDQGCLFVAPYASGGSGGSLIILDRRGEPLFYRDMPARTLGFTRQPSGLLTYFTFPHKFVVLDSTYTPVDTFKVGNGYTTDGHDIQLLPDGHVLLLAYDYEPVDMSVVVPDGDPDAMVVGLIIQELDADRNVVFQWRSWDHFEITDMAGCAGTLTASIIDYVHGNAIALGLDGNILLSSRNMCEITKIDRVTGDVLWRMAPNGKHNDFLFLDDPRGFSLQHDVRQQPDGHLTLFDNGGCVYPVYSRAVSYEIDEINKTVYLAWEYRHTPDIYGPYMGSVQRHDDGTTTIGWGTTTVNPRVTDLHAGDSTAMEVAFEGLTWTYRAFRFPWTTSIASVSPSSLDFGTVLADNSATLPVVVRNRTSQDFTITCFGQSDAHFSVDDAVPLTIPAGDAATIMVRFSPDYGIHYEGSVYVRAVNDTQLVAIPIQCTGLGSGPLPVAVADVTPERFALHAASPNPFTGETIIHYDLPRAARVQLAVFDVRGRRVETLVDGPVSAGRHPVMWSSRGRPGGVYFIRFRADGFAATQKTVILD